MRPPDFPDELRAFNGAEAMSDLTVLGFPGSTFVKIVQLVLTHKEAPYVFRDLEPEMGSPSLLALHPFDRVPILQHGDFTLYETSAIVAYLEEVFPTPALQPATAEGRARMNQWISAVNAYYYPYMIYHVSHERNVFPRLGIEPDEKVVAHALPKIEVALRVMERQLSHGQGFLLGDEVTLADYYLLPSTSSFGIIPEGTAMYADFPAVRGWRERMEALPTVQRFRAAETPRGPIEHARKWAVSHRPKY
jgi:glutathione S-transferase